MLLFAIFSVDFMLLSFYHSTVRTLKGYAMNKQNLIVGCGISGATMARLLAERGEKVTVIDSKNHNDETTELYQKYLNDAKSMPNVYSFGRLGVYKYYDMDKVIAHCQDLVKGL